MNVVSLNQQKDQTVQKLTEAKSKLLETETFLSEVSDRIAKGQQQLESLAPRVVTQSRALPNQYSVERMNTLIVELQNRRTQLLTKFRSDDRLVKEVDQQLKNTRAALDKASKETATEQSTDLNPLRQSLEAELARGKVDQAGAAGRHEMLAGQVKQYEAQLSRLEGITAEYEDLTRQIERKRRQLPALQEERRRSTHHRRARPKQDHQCFGCGSTGAVELPVRPNRPFNLILGVFLGVLLSVGSVVIAEFLRDTVLTPRELETLTGERVLASLPNTGRTRRAVVVEHRASREPEFPEPVPFAPKPRLSQPKVVQDARLEWASGE